MAEFTIRQEFDCDEDTLWEKCVFNDEYNRRLYLETLKFPGWKVLEQKDEGGSIRRKVKIDPPLGSMPAPVKKIAGDSFSYIEEGTYDRATRTYSFHVTPSVLADKSKTTGILKTEKLGDKKCVRIVKITVEVKVFMVGGMVEEKIVGDLRHSYEEAHRFTQSFVKEKGF